MLIKTNSDQKFWINVDGSRFLVCPISASRNTQIIKKNSTISRGDRSIDEDAVRCQKFIETVLDWENVKDVDNNEVPFSEAMRASFSELNRTVASAIIITAEMHDAEQQEAEDTNLGE